MTVDFVEKYSKLFAITYTVSDAVFPLAVAFITVIPLERVVITPLALTDAMFG